jgi:GAF domain-containing protein
VFAKILDSCKHLFGGDELDVLLVDGQGRLQVAAYVGNARDAVMATFPAQVEGSAPGRAITERRVVHYADVVNDPGTPPVLRRMGKVAGYHSVAFAPMLWERRGIGVVGVARSRGPFSDKELSLLQTFADQAVIAIENARLFNETKEALERQTATAEILRVISSSPTDVQPVFDAIAERARVLCGARVGVTTRFDGELMHMVGYHGTSPEAEAAMRASFPMKPGRGSINGRAILAKAPAQIADIRVDPDYSLKAAADQGNWRSSVAVPMILNGEVIGGVAVSRAEPGLFSDKLVALLQTFADQAVIAIENARLFNETKEALEQQTATAEVLQVISQSPTDVQPVFDAILDRALKLCGAHLGTLVRFDGELLHMMAYHGVSQDAERATRAAYPMQLGCGSMSARAILGGAPIQSADVLAEPDYPLKEQARRPAGAACSPCRC